MEPTFWVLQLLLLSPLALLAINLGGEGSIEPPASPSGGRPMASSSVASALGLDLQSVESSAAAAGPLGLSQFSPQERVRLMRLRELVRATRAAAPVPAPREPRVRRANTPLVARLWLPAAASALIGCGIVGIVHTSAAMDELQRSSLVTVAPVSVADRLLPGLIAHPASYLSAINGGGSVPRGPAGDGLYAAGMTDLKGAMDRSEAALAGGAGLVLLAVGAASGTAKRTPPMSVPGRTGLERTDPSADTSLAADVAPFLLVAAFLCAALSFLELP